MDLRKLDQNTQIFMVAFLGMGLLGSNFVRAMIQKGAQVQVWNRTYTRAAAMEQYGAKAFASASDAVKGAHIIHVTTKDDDSVDEVLAQASAGFEPGAVIVDHTTTSVAGAIRRTSAWKERGFVYLHAPVFMGPSNALDSTGHMLVSGDQQVIAALEPDLSKMTGKVLNFGPEPGRASAMKLLGNLYLVVFTSGIADMLSLAGALDVPVSDITTLLSQWNPGAAPLPRLQKLAGGVYENPSWELEMSRKDTQLFINGAAEAGVQLAVLPAIAREMDKWIAQGYGKNDWTVIGKAAAENIKK